MRCAARWCGRAWACPAPPPAPRHCNALWGAGGERGTPRPDRAPPRSTAQHSTAPHNTSTYSNASRLDAKGSEAKYSRANHSKAKHSKATQSKATPRYAAQSKATHRKAKHSKANQRHPGQAEQIRAKQSKAKQNKAKQSRATNKASRATQAKRRQAVLGATAASRLIWSFFTHAPESNALSLHPLGSSVGQVSTSRSVDRGTIRSLAFHEDGSLSISRLPAPEARASSARRLRALSLAWLFRPP